jgi:hypothetical protein
MHDIIPNMIARLTADQCICRGCGLSRTGAYVYRSAKSAPFLACENECTYEDTDLSISVFTQEDFEEGLPRTSNADWEYMRDHFPALLAIAEAAESNQAA